MYLDGLDGLDQKIVGLLIENARISYSDIGERIGISRVAVKARIQALEQKGIIEEYTTVINPQKISGAVSCYFEIETTPSCLAEVTEILNQHDTVTQIYRVTGKDKLHVHAVSRLRRRNGDFSAYGHRRLARGGQLQLQYDPLAHQGYQGPAVIRIASSQPNS